MDDWVIEECEEAVSLSVCISRADGDVSLQIELNQRLLKGTLFISTTLTGFLDIFTYMNFRCEQKMSER